MRRSCRKIITKYCILTALLLTFVTGCGEDNINVKEALNAVKNLDYGSAEDFLNTAEESGENKRLIDRARGIVSFFKADYDSAIEYFTDALKGSDGFVQDVDFDLNRYLGAAYVKTGRFEEAGQVYDSILEFKPQDAQVLFLRGNVYLSLGDSEKAVADFEKAVNVNPSDCDMIIDVYEALADNGLKERGLTFVENALLNEDGLDTYDEGRLYYYMGEYGKAYVALEDSKKKGGAKSYLYLGKAYEATGDYNYASNVYKEYISSKEADAGIYNQLGICELKKNNYEEALEAFRNGLKLEDQTMRRSLSFNEIVALEYLGEYEEARGLLKNYVTEYPDDEKALRELEFLSSR
ncbi:MAG: tetratricopeptide repeat protein [Lachnospiraceae bacterium]|nr:tetratricopeptide repeat protein [Lachnospiraceae bacterium]